MKDMIKRIREERDGFTLAELLIVVAIIAVLVAIAIPIFNAQLENSREATDAANLRSAYAEVSAAALTNDKSNQNGVTINQAGDEWSKQVKLTQQQDGWQNTSLTENDNTIGTKKVSDITVTAGATLTVTCKKNGDISIA